MNSAGLSDRHFNLSSQKTIQNLKLDCSSNKEIIDGWEKKLSSSDDVDHVFFIHEALRTQNILDDDNYEFSSSYSDAYRQNTLDQNERLFRLMHTRNNDCSLTFAPLERNSTTNVVNLLIQGKVVNSYVLGERETIQVSRMNFLNKSSATAAKARKMILFKAQENKCFN